MPTHPAMQAAASWTDSNAEFKSPKQGSHILIVEDDIEIARMLGETLTENGMIVEVAGNGVRMNAALLNQKFDLIVLDIMLPGENGLSICRRLRAHTNVPILMLTALGEEIDRIF